MSSGGGIEGASPRIPSRFRKNPELCERSIEGIRVTQNDGDSTEHRSHPRAQPVATSQTGIFVRRGEYWTLGYRNTSFSLKDVKGLSYIQRLLQHPGEEFHALDLLSGPDALANTESANPDNASLLVGVNSGGPGDAGEMLDAKAKKDYRRRVLELGEELEDLRERGDHEGAAKVESEIDFLVQEIARAVGLGGRDRRAGSATERARLSVTRAIKAAVQKISERQASMGELLDRAIRTGTFCSYAPNPGIQVTWQFSVGSPDAAGAVASAVPFFSPPETSFLRGFTERTTF